MTPRQRLAVEALALGAAPETAAAQAGVTERTIRRWRREDGFVAAIRCEQNRTFASARSEMRTAARVAVRVLREVAEDQTAPHPARVSAARCIFDQALRSYELDDLADRIERLELLDDERREERT